MTIDFSLEESTRRDIVALASLRIRRDHREAESQHTSEWEAVEYFIRQEKLDQLLEFYLDLYECDPVTDRAGGNELTSTEEFMSQAPVMISEARVRRPEVASALFFHFQKAINEVAAPAIATAVHELHAYDHRAGEWERQQPKTKLEQLREDIHGAAR